MTSSHNTLLALPPEILTLIASSVEGGDILNLRLTSKQLCLASAPSFGPRCFNQLRFIFSEFSLDRLVRLSEHPVFAPCIRGLSFGTTRPGPARTTPTRPAPTPNPEIEAQADFMESGQHIDLISEALVNLKKHTTDISLGIFDSHLHHGEEHSLRGYGFDKTYGASVSGRSWTVSQGLTLSHVVAAAEEANFPVHRIQLDVCRNGPSLSMIPTSLDLQLRQLLAPNSRLYPDLEIYFKTYSPDTDESGEIDFRTHGDHLGFCGRYETSKSYADFGGLFSHNWLQDMLSGCFIRTMVLRRCRVGFLNLSCLVDMFDFSLERLELIDVSLFQGLISTDSRSYQRVSKPNIAPRSSIYMFCLIQKVQPLQSLLFENVSIVTSTSPYTFRNESLLERKDWRGKAEVHAGLQAIIDEAE